MAPTAKRIKNGIRRRPRKLDEDVVKIVVIGEPQVGKTTFIRTYYQYHEPGTIDSHHGVRWFECEYRANDMYGRVAIFEIPGSPDFYLEQREPHYEDAKIFVLMYAIDDPSSFKLLTERWFPEVSDAIEFNGTPVVVIGNKKDLRNDPHVIEALALDDERPVTREQAENLLQREEINHFCEISATNLDEVNEAFDHIFQLCDY